VIRDTTSIRGGSALQDVSQSQQQRVGDDFGRSVERGNLPKLRRPDATWRNFVASMSRPIEHRTVETMTFALAKKTGRTDEFNAQLNELKDLFSAEDFDPDLGHKQAPPSNDKAPENVVDLADHEDVESPPVKVLDKEAPKSSGARVDRDPVPDSRPPVRTSAPRRTVTSVKGGSVPSSGPRLQTSGSRATMRAPTSVSRSVPDDLPQVRIIDPEGLKRVGASVNQQYVPDDRPQVKVLDPEGLKSAGRTHFQNDRALVRVVDAHVQSANKLLASMPGPGGTIAYVDRLKSKAAQLQELRTSLGKASGNLSPRALAMSARELDRQIAGLQRRAAYLTDLHNRAPVSKGAIAHGMTLRADAAMKAIMERDKKGDLSPVQTEVLRQTYLKISELKDRFENSPEWRDTTTLAEADKLFDQSDPAKLLADGFKKAKLGGAEHAFDEAYLDTLREQDWSQQISGRVEFSDDDADVSLTSQITPAAGLGNVFDSYGGHGVPSHDSTEVGHPTNLAYSELRDTGGNELFAGVRHGVHSAYGITAEHLKSLSRDDFVELVLSLRPQMTQEASSLMYDMIQRDPKEAATLAADLRAKANEKRATEVVQAALVKNSGKLDRARNGEVVTVDLTSISLLTPDTWRGAPQPKHDNERLMLAEQKAAYDALSGDPQPKTIKVRTAEGEEVEIKVRVSVTTFNFGVNAGAFSSAGSVGQNKFGGWDRSTEMNTAAMKTMLGDTAPDQAHGWQAGGRVGEFLKEQRKALAPLEQQIAELTKQKDRLDELNDQSVGSLDERIARGDKSEELGKQIAELNRQAEPLRHKIKVVRDLSSQIRTLWNTDAYKKQGQEPYKMVSRLAVLAYHLGDTPVWNCKSGKDRTGELDAEAKFLAWQIDAHGYVPEPDHKRTPEEQNQLFQMIANSGNLEMQQLNTGFPGYKLGGVSSLQKQFGSDEAGKWHRGVSDKVKT
jgi:phosphatidylinositol-4,5-bisphosphate 4-phosphatase